MNREAIEQRMSELKSQLEQLRANGNALLGAIQECDYWLARLVVEPEENKQEDIT